MLKLGMSAIAGKVQGLWNKETKSFDVKRGITKSEKRYQVFTIQVSSKNQDDTWTNGKGIDVMMFGDTKVEHGDIVGLVGRFQPNNYEKDGKVIYGNQFMCNAEDMFVPEKWESKKEDKPTKKTETEIDVW